MQEYYNSIDVNPFSVLPLTFLVNKQSDPEFANFEKYYNNFTKLIAKLTAKQKQEIKEYI